MIMAKLSQQNQKNNAQSNNKNNNSMSDGVTKVKRTRRSVPRDSPPQRSSIYRGVTRQGSILRIVFLVFLIVDVHVVCVF